MVTTATNQRFMTGLDVITEKASSRYSARLDAKEVLNEIAVQARHTAIDAHPSNPAKEVAHQLQMQLGESEAYLLVLGEKFKHIDRELTKQQQQEKHVEEYIERYYEEYLCETKTILGSNLQYAIEDNICDDVDLIASKIFKFCHKNLITIKW